MGRLNGPPQIIRRLREYLRDDSPEMLARLGGIPHSPLSSEKFVAYYRSALHGVKLEDRGMKRGYGTRQHPHGIQSIQLSLTPFIYRINLVMQ